MKPKRKHDYAKATYPHCKALINVILPPVLGALSTALRKYPKCEKHFYVTRDTAVMEVRVIETA